MASVDPDFDEEQLDLSKFSGDPDFDEDEDEGMLGMSANEEIKYKIAESWPYRFKLFL